MEFEACIESLEGALLAQKYGADRVELCSALHEGGLSPSGSLVQQVVEKTNIPVFAMIRPIAGGFVYDENTLDLMLREIAEMAKAGAKGVVFGVLQANFELDLAANARLLQKSRECGLMPICHRAFDFTPDPYRSLEQIIELGFYRLLSSGQKPLAIEGLSLLKELHLQAQGRIEIMAGSGVSSQAIAEFKESGIDAVHFTVGAFEENVPLGMGARLISNPDKVGSILAQKS